jgi:hypothetical protein
VKGLGHTRAVARLDWWRSITTSMIVLNFGTARSRVVQGSEEQSGAEIESECEEEKMEEGSPLRPCATR